MTRKEEIKEVAMVSAIISNHICEELYPKMQNRGQGYISTVEEITDWAVEFVKMHKRTNWEDVLENETLKPLTGKINSITCWDDCVYDFAHFKLSKF